MNGIRRAGRRGGVILFIVVGLLILSSVVTLGHAGRLLKLISFQRETMQRLRASDIPTRSATPAPCEVSKSRGYFPEQELGRE